MPIMDKWGAALYGNPCRSCGFDWDVTPERAVESVRLAPAGYRRAVAGSAGTERHPDLGWTSTGYVAHVGDNLRIWAAYLAGARLGGDTRVSGYDPDLVGQGRRYDALTLPGALWSLERATAEWAGSVLDALRTAVVLDHATRGEQTAADIARNGAHDVHHHLWDIGRIRQHADGGNPC